MGRRKDKPRLIPEQDKRICRAICLCQLTMVLSCVSIVYLSVAIYSPSFKAFKAGFEVDPVMCQTNLAEMPERNCAWASCGEWCLTRTSGFCPQFYSTVRRNGTDVQFNNCTKQGLVTCKQPEWSSLLNYNCNNGSVCNKLSGLFSCSKGHCRNISQSFQCDYHADGPTINSEKDNNKLNGFFKCSGVHCTKVKKHFTCDRICLPQITTVDITVFLMNGDSVEWADCDNVVALNEARGNEPGVLLPSPVEFWKDDDGVLIANCASLEKITDPVTNLSRIIGKDCLNGTLLPTEAFPKTHMNFTQFWEIYESSTEAVDPEQRFLPNQGNLTIYKSKKLYINLEGCVNTLRSECKEFAARHGSDGTNHTAQSRYECYYHKDPLVDFVTARYDLKKVYNELLFSLIVPVVLFVISSITLIVITKSVKVGDDAKMRCTGCCGDDNSDAEEIYSSRKSKRMRQKPVMEANENLNQLTNLKDPNISPGDAVGIGSTNALLPLSPTNDSGTSENTNDDEKATKFDVPEKPLVVL